MSRKEEHELDTNSIFDTAFTVTAGTVVPSVADLTFENVAKDIPVAMLFIDIKGSTHIVNAVQRQTAAKMYKAFLKGVTKIARANNGDVRSFNGDGVLVVFAGATKSNNAVRAAMEMKYFFQEILTPKLNRYKVRNLQLQMQNIQFNFGIGIDLGDILVIKAGIGGENNRDLVWVGSATNHAVKLAEQAHGENNIHISHAVHAGITDQNLLHVNSPALANSLLGPYFRTPIWTQVLPLILAGYFGSVYTTKYRMPIS